ncbi:MAG TPA: Verru_Chthon cassette protein B [Chthoniobacterales bacterium]|nr:Verru_Chthon cassette protein B [Chthoniobacterales bacterium]
MKAQERHMAFSLVEVTLALGVAAISLLVIFSLLPIGLQTNQRSIEQTASADILSAVAADLRSTPVTSPRGNATSSIQFGIPVPAAGGTSTTILFFNGAGRFASSQQPDSRYRATVTFMPNGGTPKTASFARLQVSWPAVAAITGAQGSAEMFAAFDRN